MMMGLLGRVQWVVAASSGTPVYQPMYSFWPATSKAAVKGSSLTISLPLARGPMIAEVMGRVGSCLRASVARLVRNLVRVGLLGVSLETDQRMTEALLRSRRIISLSMNVALA